MGENPASFLHPDRPIETVSWEDCQRFLEKLNALSSAYLPFAYGSGMGICGKRREGMRGIDGITEIRWELIILLEVAWHDVNEGNSHALSASL